MNAVARAALVCYRPLVVTRSGARRRLRSRPPDLAGAWVGDLSHEGETTRFGLELEPDADGKILVKMSLPIVHISHQPIGKMPLAVSGAEVKLGPLVLTYDAAARTLSGTMPAALVPVYSIPFTLRHVDRLDLPGARGDRGAGGRAGLDLRRGRAALAGSDVRRAAPSTPAARTAASTRSRRRPARSVGRSGREARSGPWSTVAGDALYFQADDGFLYKVARGQRQGGLAGPGRDRDDRAPALRQPQVALRPLRLGA